jgi:peptidoglycan/LPS O-acetylase OafA/YrhL
MPEPIGRGQRYIPGLDGLRAFAVIAVVAFHLGVGWASGGLLGVGVFFTLSGYLITSLLLSEFDARGHVELKNFWVRRARRLLPAALTMLVLVTAWVTLLHPAQLSALRGAFVSAFFYVNNWWLIFRHVSYFDRISTPSPLGHLWSLSVEEQFYLIWPWLLLLGLRYIRGRNADARLAAITLALAAGSAVLMAVLYNPAADATRVYDGTDTRAFGLLIGAALAMVWRPGHFTGAARLSRYRRHIDWVGAVALVGIVVMIWRTTEYSPFIYRGGLVLLSVATALVIAAVVIPTGRLGRVLGAQPLRWIGVRSYGIYLWHYPIIILTTPMVGARIGLGRAFLQVLATLVVSALSWRYIEEPIRRGALRRFSSWRGLRTSHTWVRGWRLLPATLTVAVVATACVGMSPNAISSSSGHSSSTSISIDSGPAASPSSAVPSSAAPSAVPSTSRPPAKSVAARPIAASKPAVAPGTSSCSGVTHIGDSTSEGMVSPDYLSSPAQRLPAQYARVGIHEQHIEISGGTSIVETSEAGQPNAFQVAQKLVSSGYHGCWVLALGTNDTADVAVGSVLDQAGRIAKMMQLLGSQPVMWVNVKSLRSSGPYSNANMQTWDKALLAACSKYPNMRVYDWASVVQNAWFIDDAIHYTSTGYAARAQDIANALAKAYPAGGPPSTGCIVH